MLNGTLLNEFQVVGLYKQAFDQFKQDHPDFGGAKIIYAPLRRVDNATMDRIISLASQLKVHLIIFALLHFNVPSSIGTLPEPSALTGNCSVQSYQITATIYEA